MNVTPTDEQQQMRESARDFFESNEVLDLARRRIDGDEDVVPDLWADLADVDFTRITVPIEHEGLGEDALYLALFLEEAGRFAMPGPFPETMAFAVPLIADLGTDEQRSRHLPAIADGEEMVTYALYEAGEPLPGDIQVRASVRDDGFELSGTKTLVPYADATDTALLAARTQDGTGYDGISLFLVDLDEVETEEQHSLNRTRPSYRLHLDGVTLDESSLLGPLHGGGGPLQRGLDDLRTAMCAMIVGAADEYVDATVEHGKSREQFGESVGRFQAVKHRTADMWMDMQAARSLVYYAAWALANDEPDAPQAVSAAKAYCSAHMPELFADGIQNHGGMGFTWDHDGHVYLKQAKAWENVLGSARDHRSWIVESL